MDENDLINKITVDPIIIHHQYHHTQLKSSISSSGKSLPFGPKYTGEGKLDFYAQDNPRKSKEDWKEDPNSYEPDLSSKNDKPGAPQRAKFVPVANTR